MYAFIHMGGWLMVSFLQISIPPYLNPLLLVKAAPLIHSSVSFIPEVSRISDFEIKFTKIRLPRWMADILIRMLLGRALFTLFVRTVTITVIWILFDTVVGEEIFLCLCPLTALVCKSIAIGRSDYPHVMFGWTEGSLLWNWKKLKLDRNRNQRMVNENRRLGGELRRDKD